MRYLKQRDRYSCGPTALANMMLWTGIKESASSMRKKFIKFCNCIPGYGCSTGVLENTLFYIKNIDFETIEWPTLRKLDRHLDSGGIAIIRIRHKIGGHFYLCTRKTKKMYEVVNRKAMGPAVSKISRKTMKNDLSYTNGSPGNLHFAVAWMVKKNEKYIP